MTESKPGTRTIETQLEINAPVEAVWKALTDAEELTNWFPITARVKPGPGGSIRWTWDEEINWESRIEIWEPHQRLRAVYDQQDHHASGSASAVASLAMDFTLESQGGKTVLRLVHSGFGAGSDWDEIYNGTRTGWNFELQGLRHYLENHPGTKRKVAWARTPISCSWEEAWGKLMSPEGLLRKGQLDAPQKGKPYKITAATGDTFEGNVIVWHPPREFAATVENMNNSLLRLAVENCGKGPEAWIFLETFGLPEAEVNGFRDRWAAQLQKLFPGT